MRLEGPSGTFRDLQEAAIRLSRADIEDEGPQTMKHLTIEVLRSPEKCLDMIICLHCDYARPLGWTGPAYWEPVETPDWRSRKDGIQ